jgi:hypothetical protein
MNSRSSFKKQKQVDYEEYSENNDLILSGVNRSSNRSRPPIDREHEEFKKLNEQKDWTVLNTWNSEPPNDYTVTHINQTHDFLVRTKI